MKISELKRIAKENNYELTEYLGDYKFVRISKFFEHYITISNKCENKVWTSIKNWCDEKDFNMLKGAIEFAETPLEDREEIKKYFYEHNSMKTKGGNPTYLAIKQRPSISYPVLQGSSKDVFEYKVEFTDDEIEIFRKEYGICLDNFEKNEVEE